MSARPPLGPAGWLLVVRMAFWRATLPLLKRVVSLERLVRLIASPRARLRDAGREQLISRVGARLWRSAPGPCLERSLAVYRALGLAGATPRLAVGVAGEDGAVVGHVWVLVDGAPVLEQSDPAAEFGVVVTFDESGQRET